MAELEKIVRIKRLTKQFDGHVVLNGISLEVERGENLVVFGRSGTGKSVLLKCSIGLMKPDKGEVFLFGQNIFSLSIKELNRLRKRTGFLFQSGALYDSMTVKENLAFPLKRNFDFDEKTIEEKIMNALEMVG